MISLSNILTVFPFVIHDLHTSKNNELNETNTIILPQMMKLFEWYSCISKLRFWSAHISNMATLVGVGSRLSIQKNIIVAYLISVPQNPYMFVNCPGYSSICCKFGQKIHINFSNENCLQINIYIYIYIYIYIKP